MNLRNGLLLIGVALAVTFALVFGQRLSDEAMAVVVGAICGISASIPVSIGLAIAASRGGWGRAEPPRPTPYTQSPQPSILIVPNPGPPTFRYGGTAYYLPALQTRMPEIKTIGERTND